MSEKLPDYAPQLDAFHGAFATELKGTIDSLPLAPHQRVLDVGCGDGFYSSLIAQRLVSPGGVVGLDVSDAYLEVARKARWVAQARCGVEFVLGELETFPREHEPVDLAWCAQSLYSLPDPVDSLRQMAVCVRPGGIVAVLENDTLHQVLLPWPGRLELALRQAEMDALRAETGHPSKFYVGRRLPAVFAAAGLEPLRFRTQCIDRQAPLDADLEAFLRSYLVRLSERVAPYLDAATLTELQSLIDPAGDDGLLRQEYFTMSWINVLVWGRRK